MLHDETLGLLAGAVVLGAIHGVEPGHGWPVAASYALDQTNKWLYGFAASLLLGVGHLISSIAMVTAFFYAKESFDLMQANESLTILGDIQIGGPVSLMAGILLIILGIREYFHGSHDDHASDDTHHSHNHGQSHSENDSGLVSRLKGYVPIVGGHSYNHDEAADRGLFGIAWFAFILGFAHEEEFEIIALCAGSDYCLELMGAYAVTVIIGIVGMTMLLIAGYEYYEETVKQYTPYLPAFSGTILIIIGLGFIIGLL